MDGPSKYTPLASLLAAAGDPLIELTFAEVDKLLPGGLPESAYRYRTWWTSVGNSAQCRYGWIAVGYRVARVDLAAQVVRFTNAVHNGAHPGGILSGNDHLPTRSNRGRTDG